MLQTTFHLVPCVYYKHLVIKSISLLQTFCRLLHLFITNIFHKLHLVVTNIFPFSSFLYYKHPVIYSILFITNIFSFAPFVYYKRLVRLPHLFITNIISFSLICLRHSVCNLVHVRPPSAQWKSSEICCLIEIEPCAACGLCSFDPRLIDCVGPLREFPALF